MRVSVAAAMAAVGMLASAAGARETTLALVGPQCAAGGAQRFHAGIGFPF
jgi:hypothetical protein